MNHEALYVGTALMFAIVLLWAGISYALSNLSRTVYLIRNVQARQSEDRFKEWQSLRDRIDGLTALAESVKQPRNDKGKFVAHEPKARTMSEAREMAENGMIVSSEQ